MHVTAQLASDERHQHRLGLIGLVTGLAIGGVTLLATAGPPRLPAELPNQAALTTTLNGSYLPPEAVAYAVTTAAWLIWAWLVLSLAFRLVVVGADTIAHGAAWVKVLRLASDRMTLPVVRRLVDGAVVTVLVVNLVARAAPASAAPISSPTAAVIMSAGVTPPSSPERPPEDSEARSIQYTVQPGDTLWTIAERFYGTGFEYGRLVRANAGRPMRDGGRFTRTGVIQPGWSIVVPLPSQAIEEVDGQIYYVVEDEDTLRGVAARLLGDEEAWVQIFEANRDTARLPNRRALSRPDLIWPGLRLLVPSALPVGGAPAPASDPPAVPEIPPASPPTLPIIVEPSPEPNVPTPEPTVRPESVVPPSSATADITPEPSVTPVPTESVPVATPVMSEEPTTGGEVEPYVAPPAEIPSNLIYGTLGFGALGAAAGAALFTLRRLRRRLTESWTPDVPEEGPASNEGFAEAELTRVLEHRLQGGEVEPAVIVANQALRYFDEHDLDEVEVVTVGQRRSAVSLTLSAGLASQSLLLTLAPEFGVRLGGAAEAWRTEDHDVLVRVSGLKLSGLYPSMTAGPADAPILLPLAVLPGRETLYVNWDELGHVLVAGLPGGGVDVVLTSLLGALSARRRPNELRLVTVASRRMLPSAVFDLPHQARKAIAPNDEDAMTEVLQALRQELERRMQLPGHDADGISDRPDIVVVIGDLDAITGDTTTFELLGVHGAVHGIRLLAASTRPETFGDELLAHFSTRIALQTIDEDASIRLIGRPDAADLGGGGDLLVRIDGRVPLRARGFRLPPEHLDRLVKLMREAYSESCDQLADQEDRSRQGIPAGNDSGRQTAPPVDTGAPNAPVIQVADAAPSAARHGLRIESSLPLNGVGAETASHGNSLGAEPSISARPAATDDEDVAMAESTACPLPIQVKCFGSFRVTSGYQELSPTGSEGAHYKSWDILAFLCAQPGGSISRELLIGALWPDVDSSKAANRLKVSLTRLRRMLKKQVPELAGEVVRVDRSGVCRLNAGFITSDVHQFVALRRSASKLPPADAANALEEARALYRGDLLTEPYYEWVHTRADDGLTLREQYREEYYRVTQRLAELYRQHGDAARAVTLYRDILKLEPTLEDVARSLYRCYQDVGDRGALVREHRRLRDALRQMLGASDDPDDDPELYEPESETVAAYEEALAAIEARSAVGRTA